MYTLILIYSSYSVQKWFVHYSLVTFFGVMGTIIFLRILFFYPAALF